MGFRHYHLIQFKFLFKVPIPNDKIEGVLIIFLFLSKNLSGLNFLGSCQLVSSIWILYRLFTITSPCREIKELPVTCKRGIQLLIKILVPQRSDFLLFGLNILQ